MRMDSILGFQAKLVEPSFSALPEEAYAGIILTMPGDEARLVVDEEDWPLALAVHAPDGWAMSTFALRPPVIEVVERFEALGGEIVRSSQEEWMLALREHYSLQIQSTVHPAMEDLSPDRTAKVEDLLRTVWSDREGEECLDCGCGSGMGSLALRRIGLVPLAYDNDTTLLSLGLAKGRLIPERTMCIDACLLSHYTRPVPLGLALMAGTINDFTALMWKGIIGELLEMTDEALVTVETEKEAELVKLWALGAGKEVERFENERDPFYDRWVLLARD